MKIAVGVIALVGVLLPSPALAQELEPPSLPPDFGERAMAHVRELSAIGLRRGGDAGEREAFALVARELREAGLDVTLEPFEFEQFRLSRAVLEVSGREYAPTRVGVDPYSDTHRLEGDLVLYDPGTQELDRDSIRGSIVVTHPAADYFSVAFRGAKAIVYVAQDDFFALQHEDPHQGVLTLVGTVETRASSNLVARPGWTPAGPHEVIVTAHMDSKVGPGADDNASGVGVLLELASHIQDVGPSGLPDLRFVVFGAEELGVLGSRVYLLEHQAELRSCRFVFNMDGVGGDGDLLVEMNPGPIAPPDQPRFDGIPAPLRTTAWEGPESEWLLESPALREIFAVSNVPWWLRRQIEEAAGAMGIQIGPRGPMGADQQVFAQAGIPATSIAVTGNTPYHHTPEDLPGRVHPDGLSRAGNFAFQVILAAVR